MANISFTSPFIRAFTHTETSVGTSAVTALAAAVTPERRVSVIIQNQHASAILTVVFASTGTAGLKVKAGESISLDNYNGIIRCISDTAATPVHIAYAIC
jgi:uncharacterized protein (DUF111 family)